MRRPDEVPTVDVVMNMLGGLAIAVLLFALGDAIRAGHDNLAEF